MDSAIRGARREKILTAANDRDDLTDHPDAQDEKGWPLARIVRVVEYTAAPRGAVPYPPHSGERLEECLWV
jgi:hypothetical protein